MRALVYYNPSPSRMVDDLIVQAVREHGGCFNDYDGEKIDLDHLLIVSTKRLKEIHIVPLLKQKDVLRPIYLDEGGKPRLSAFPICGIVHAPNESYYRGEVLHKVNNYTSECAFDTRYRFYDIIKL